MKLQGNNRRNDKVANLLAELAAEFLARESNRQSLITVTHARMSPDLKRATVVITVLPDEQEATALDFARRKRRELREYVKSRTKFRVLPFLDVEIDKGQKLEQRFNELK